MTGIVVSSVPFHRSNSISSRSNSNRNNNNTSHQGPLKRGLRQGPPSRRSKQISHESTSSFFTNVTTASSTTAAPGEVAPVRRSLAPTLAPPVEERNEQGPKRVVECFIALRQAGEVEAAAQLLDPAVQVSYPGMPFCKSAADWKRFLAQPMARTIDQDHAWQVLQKGAHAGQVMRRGCVRSGRRKQAVIEVFELHEKESNNNNNNNDKNGDNGWVIGAMYLRNAPWQWTLWGGRGANNKNKAGKKNKTAKENRLSGPSQRLEREMLQGDASEQGYYSSGNHQYCYYDSSDDYDYLSAE